MSKQKRRCTPVGLTRSHIAQRGTIARAVAVAAVVSLLAAATASAKGPRNQELSLDLLNVSKNVVSIHPNNGWQLTATFIAKESRLLGIGRDWFPPMYPASDQTGYVVFSDPDGCASFLLPGWQALVFEDYYCLGTPDPEQTGCVPPYWPDDPDWPGLSECPPSEGQSRTDWFDDLLASGLQWPRDETWVELTPGLSVPDSLFPAELAEPRPLLWTWTPLCATPPCLTPFGPQLGSTEDDTRYGSWRRLPGLVVLADHGPGVRTKLPEGGDLTPAADFFDLYEPAEAWNLAGFFNSAAYSLMGGTRETSITAHLNTANDLFSPVVLVDKHITVPTEDAFGVLCGEGDALYRMDGGPLTCSPGGLSLVDGLLNGTIVTVRVFMVDGIAPDVLTDEDGDGDVDIDDAVLMGFDPLSPEKTASFSQFHEDECGFVFDFDGDGNPGGCVAPGRPGGLTRPPR